MANSIKIGNLDISAFKVGSADCRVYLGDTCVYSGDTPTPPAFEGKYKLTLNDGSTVSAACDGTSVITADDIEEYRNTLVSVEIGDCVTEIDLYTFSACESITSCTIGSAVTSIGNGAFSWSNPTSITVNATTPPTLGSNVFPGSYPIYVPAASIDTYKLASGWDSYSSRIRAIP